MRRVSVDNVVTGMKLAHTVYDIKGYPVVTAGEVLNDRSLAELAHSCSSEVLIDDPVSGDLLINPVFPAELEAKCVQALTGVVAAAADGAVQAAGLGALIPLAKKLVGCVVPYMIGDVDIPGCHSLNAYQHMHAVKTAELSLGIGRIAGLEQEELTSLALAALLMNIGYAGFPPGLLDHPRALTEEEWVHVRNHPRHSLELLAASGLSHDAFLAIAHHHERWDGTGYPAGRRGDEISRLGRIITVADSYISLRSRRPHREAMRPDEAIEFIMAYAGEYFDPEIAQIVVRQIPQYPSGVSVVLNSGEAGVVTVPNVGFVARPVVRVCAVSGSLVRKPYDLDLSARQFQAKMVVAVDM